MANGRASPSVSQTGSDPARRPSPPTTRYYGSKHKLLDWIWSHLRDIDFGSALDAFSGSACVGYRLKQEGKQVTCNDVLRCNHQTALALVANDRETLSRADATRLIRRRSTRRYDDLIERTFHGIYFLDDENRWLDVVCQNIAAMRNRTKAALAYHALFQAAVAKRPYNLFHRRNLYMRTADVPRSFGNKATWDRPFAEHFRGFAAEASAAVFAGAAPCQATNQDVRDVAGTYDLVYIDPPYINGRGVGVDYRGYYHFLEGMTDYRRWADRIDYGSKHRRLRREPSPWTDPKRSPDELARLFERHANSVLVVSYRSDGVPSPQEIRRRMARFKRRVVVHQPERRYQYVLSTNRRSTELLFVGTD